MNKLININNFRVNYSSHSNIFNPDGIKYHFSKYIDNNKIININNFDIKIKNKKIKYSTFYTNPFKLNKKIINMVNFSINRTNTIKINKSSVNLLDQILIDKITISKKDKIYLETIIIKKKFDNKFISMEESFIIMLYLIIYDKNVLDKDYYLNLLNYYWLKFKSGTFDLNEIIIQFINLNNYELNNVNFIQFICEIKFYISFYILLEEFHQKYILIWLNLNKSYDQKSKFIFNSNYVKINPQEILNNVGGKYYTNISDLLEQIQIPLGHNILFIFNFNKVYYYDSDEQDLYDIFKLTQLFNQIGFKFANISNRQPIQKITDDGNCLFYCLRFVQYIFEFDIKINLDSLKTCVLVYEKKILTTNDMYGWIKNFV